MAQVSFGPRDAPRSISWCCGDPMTARIITIEAVAADRLEDHIEALAEILHACVHDNASIGFILPFELEDARKFWRDSVVPALADGTRTLLVATLDGEVVGTAQLGLAGMPNQAHRADVMKVLVHPICQRKGIGRALMAEIERIAPRLGRML